MNSHIVFLDRDGVINRALILNGIPTPPQNVADVEVLPGVDDALRSLSERGFSLVVVTNQPDVARGKQTRAGVEAIHFTLSKKLPLTDFRTCYHDDADACQCRKPAPGLLLSALQDYHACPKSCFMIGDRWRDIEAGYRAGCTNIYIDNHFDTTIPEHAQLTVSSLGHAAEWILRTTG